MSRSELRIYFSAPVGFEKRGCYKHFAATPPQSQMIEAELCLLERMSLQQKIEELAARNTQQYSQGDFALFNEFKTALNRGEVRAASPDSRGHWQTNTWVKRGILLGFRMGAIVEISPPESALQ